MNVVPGMHNLSSRLPQLQVYKSTEFMTAKKFIKD
jgi:hypothetical protein